MATPYEAYPYRKPEAPTNPRYSLSNDLIGSRDFIVGHPTGRVRLLVYENATEEQMALRDQLIDHNLIAGELITDSPAEAQAFKMPQSARPIKYESSEESEGAYSYSDEQMFYDIGCVFSMLAQLAASKVIAGDVGKSLVIVEFAKPGTRQLFLVPGVEKILQDTNPDQAPLDYYLQALKDTFGPRLSENEAMFFRMGFVEAENN